jgi:hypothetical protein
MTVAAQPRERPHECWTRAYWLEHCEGFRVETSQGCFGFVEEVIWDREKEKPITLLVRKSHAASGLIEVSIARVGEVRPEAEEIFVFAAIG